MDEQTANIRTLIPKLTQQMEDSNVMQEKVFQEMTKLIPAFIKGLGAGAQDIKEDIVSEASPNSIIGIASGKSPQITELINWLSQLTKLATTNSLLPKAYADPPDITINWTPPEYGDQSPPKVFADQPENDPEFVKAKNDLAYRQAQLIKNVTPPKRLQSDYNADRRTEIAKSGLSPLATNAVKTFKANIDNTALALNEATTKLTSIKASPKYPAFNSHRTEANNLSRTISSLTQKLGALRIKFRTAYGYYY